MNATLGDFKKLDIRIGKIKKVERVRGTDKLLLLGVDWVEEGYCQIISGIAEYFEGIKSIVGRQCPFFVNLEPKIIRGFESKGMILAVLDFDNTFSLLEPEEHIPVGNAVK